MMASSGLFFLVSLLTAPITLRSNPFSALFHSHLNVSRVLLATIKYFGGCPCPRCFIEKDKIPDMGTKADMKRRKNIREDTSIYRGVIKLVRSWIFGRGLLVAGAAVGRKLKQYSWVPTRVRAFSISSMLYLPLLVECIFKAGRIWFQFLYHVRS
jgi:hypothetical protein